MADLLCRMKDLPAADFPDNTRTPLEVAQKVYGGGERGGGDTHAHTHRDTDSDSQEKIGVKRVNG